MKNSFHFLCVLLGTGISFLLNTHPVIDKLDLRIKQSDSIACCGLDPDPSKMPRELLDQSGSIEEKAFIFLKEVVSITADNVCAYKIQKAFFDQFSHGTQLLYDIIHYIHAMHNDIPVFLDCKIGDIGNTMQVYLHSIFENYEADGVVVNPYMGDDIFKALEAYPDRAAIVLVQTSNLGAHIVQSAILETGIPVWQMILDLVVNRWNKYNNLIPVIASTGVVTDLAMIRKSIPDSMPILFAGIGAQGGDSTGLTYLLDHNNRGVFVNSSRDLLYPYNPEQSDWRSCIERAVKRFKRQLNEIRTHNSCEKFVLLLGVSGVGKSTIIDQLKKLDDRFVYISPFTTRPLRPNEQDKISISIEEMDRLESQGLLLTVNKLYGTAYGTPLDPIEKALRNGQIPLLDWPIQKIDIMKKTFGDKLFCVYVTPPSLAALKEHLAIDGRDKNGERFLRAQQELNAFEQGIFDSYIDMHIIYQDGQAAVFAKEILSRYTKFLARGQTY